jgi:hypothetical protein
VESSKDSKNNGALKLEWPAPAKYDTKITAYEVLFKAKDGRFAKAQNCAMETRSIFFAKRSLGK